MKLNLEKLKSTLKTMGEYLFPVEKVTSYFKNNFLKRYKQAEVFFKPKSPKNHFNFNLRGCIISILKSSNISDIWASKADTYKYPKKYFSYRYSVHEGNKDYGRMLSVILK